MLRLRLLSFLLFLLSTGITAQQNIEKINILVFTKTNGYRHASIPKAVKTFYELGQERGWNITASEDNTLFDNIILPRYDVIVFANTSEDVLNAGQQNALKKWYQQGNGVVAIHGAADTEYDWMWFNKLIGTHFKAHPKPQEGTLIIENYSHPAMWHFRDMDAWTTFDEWYTFKSNPREHVNVLLSLDEASIKENKPEAIMGDHPITWYQQFEGGRSIFIGKGHNDEVFNDVLFRKHLVGSVEWASNKWEYPFDTETLTGWTLKGGHGKFYVEDGMIIAETAMGNPNSFLCTERQYDDFILELEFKTHPDLNTGVQYRSHVHDMDVTVKYMDGRMNEGERTFKAGTVYGYQYDIDPSTRAWTGGFYEEGRRGWIENLDDKPEAQQAFKQNEWNHLRIVANGDHITTWINGVQAVNVEDNLLDKGFIGLQLHSIYNEKDAGKKIYWRNIKIRPL